MATDATTPEPKAYFSPKEQQVLQVAWLCLKSGPPELDIQRLLKLGNFKTAKTASNTWGVIKKKLLAMPDAQGETFTPKAVTPKADEATDDNKPSKKRSKNTAEGDSAAKAKKIKSAEASADSDSDLSAVDEQVITSAPAKKQRKSSAKKSKAITAETIAGQDMEDTEDADSNVKAEEDNADSAEA